MSINSILSETTLEFMLGQDEIFYRAKIQREFEYFDELNIIHNERSECWWSLMSFEPFKSRFNVIANVFANSLVKFVNFKKVRYKELIFFFFFFTNFFNQIFFFPREIQVKLDQPVENHYVFTIFFLIWNSYQGKTSHNRESRCFHNFLFRIFLGK